MKKLILITGGMRAGKDTFADACIKSLEERGLSSAKLSLASKMKELVAKIEQQTGVQIGKNRKLLQWIGTEWGRGISENLWVHALQKKIQEMADDIDYIFIADCRFLNELRWPELWQPMTIYIHANDTIRIARGAQISSMGHQSERLAAMLASRHYNIDFQCGQTIDGHPYETLVNNGVIEEFEQKAEDFVARLIGG